jgi:hypothetical protein
VAVVVLGEGAGAPRLERLAQGREAGQLDAVAADPAGEAAAGGPDDEAALVEGEDGGEVVRGDPGDPVEAAAEQVIGVHPWSVNRAAPKYQCESTERSVDHERSWWRGSERAVKCLKLLNLPDGPGPAIAPMSASGARSPQGESRSC